MSTSTELSYIRAVNAALEWALATDPSTVVFGEDVAIPDGPFGATKGLHKQYGKRVFDTPISESAMIGAALGASMSGLRPVVEIMYMDFTLVAMDQIVNQVANTHYVTNGAFRAPLVIRTQSGHSPGSCAQHSQCLEAFFLHTPGLRLAAPSNPADAYDILRSAIFADDPVVVVESRMLYADKGPVHLGSSPSGIGKSKVTRTGEDVTIVSWSRTAKQALEAGAILEASGISAEVIDLRWLSPLDLSPVLASLEKTRHLVVAHEANVTGGFGAEIAARVYSQAYDLLGSPIQRVGARDVPVPAAPTLQEVALPDADDIVAAARACLVAQS